MVSDDAPISYAEICEQLRDRRAARAAYGRALLAVDYATPQDVRDAAIAALRDAIRAAERRLAEALEALEVQL